MKLKIALLLTVVAIGLHAYLTNHYFELKFGMAAAESACNINQTFNCDAVAASDYSTFLGAPLALWGAVTNGMLFLLLLGWIIGWTNDLARLGRYTLWMAGGIALASVVMAIISLVALTTFCIFCIGAYVISFINLWLIYGAQEPDARPGGQYLKELLTEERIYLVYILAIPLITLFTNHSMTSKAGPQALLRVAKNSLTKWRTAPSTTFNSEPVLVRGASDDKAKFTIVEFADFTCGHCKNAAPTLKAFVSSRADVQLRFYSFPLDGTCNEAVKSQSGVPCFLAKAVTCAEKEHKGWSLHDAIFARQQDFFAGLDNAKTLINKVAGDLGLNQEAFNACVEGAEVHERIKKMAKEAADAGVAATPNFFVNGKMLEGAQLLPILEAAYSEAKGQKSLQ